MYNDQNKIDTLNDNGKAKDAKMKSLSFLILGRSFTQQSFVPIKSLINAIM